jgi:flagellar hook-length control protein FliK
MTMRLDPPHLGTIQMNVAVNHGMVTATIETSTESARQMLQSDMTTLKQALSDAGINVDAINVSVSTDLNQGWRPPTGGQTTPDGRSNFTGGRHPFGFPNRTNGFDSALSSSPLQSGRFDYLA